MVNLYIFSAQMTWKVIFILLIKKSTSMKFNDVPKVKLSFKIKNYVLGGHFQISAAILSCALYFHIQRTVFITAEEPLSLSSCLAVL